MKTTVYEFRQAVLGISYLKNFDEKQYDGRKQFLDENDDKVVITSEDDMTSFERAILEEYQENESEYRPSLTGDLF
jgi:hypothetical protein